MLSYLEQPVQRDIDHHPDISLGTLVTSHLLSKRRKPSCGAAFGFRGRGFDGKLQAKEREAKLCLCIHCC